MASQQTGHLDKTFLANAITVPVTTTAVNGRGGTPTTRRFGNRQQRSFNRMKRGNVTHTVTSSGTVKIRPDSPQTL